MRKFGLIGFPLEHSFSKKYFTDKFQRENIKDCLYENFPLTSIDNLPQLLEEESDLCGINVTIPYKKKVLRYLHSVSSETSAIGAVNVVKIRRYDSELKLYGFNTDITGIHDSIVPYLTGRSNNAIVLGTGGSSRAVCYVLKKLGMSITLVSRSRKPDAIEYSELTRELIANADLIVNTTPLGMYPNTDDKPDIDYSLLGKKHILFDLVYNPEVTQFLRMGAGRGCSVISGIKMLHSQAEKAWEIWNDNSL
jgi:shikimate dehydrogenase